MLSTKFESLNSKQILNSNSQNSKQKFGTLGFRIWDLFRISDFGFRIFSLLNVTLIVTFCILNFNCYAQSISSTQLINNAKEYDGKIVTYEGEVIGDIMLRGEYAWINVNDGQNAIGIWMDKNLTKDILYTGSYKFKGDWIEITGIFQRTCLQHGGDLDIHAQAIRKVKQGRQTIERLNMGKRNLALVLLGILGILLILRRIK